MKLLRSHLYALAVVTVLVLPIAGIGPRGAGQEIDTEALYQKVVKSVAYVVEPRKGGYARGSGSLISVERKLVLTNYHVVSQADDVFVQFPMYNKKTGEIITNPKEYMENITLNKALKGRVLYRDKSRDLALVEVSRVPSGTPAIPLAKHSPGRGQTVWNIGSPGAVEQLFGITQGTVRAVGVEDHLVGGSDEVFRLNARMVTATNPTNPGDSGGPLFNSKGYQVAVTESGRPSAQQVNFFVDITEVRAFLNEKKITIKELSDEPDPKGPDKKEPKKDATTPPKDNGTTPPPPKKADAATVPDKKDDAAAPSEADEKAAADLLRRTGIFANDPDNKEYYMGRLREVIKKHPGTAAAKEAQKKLDALK